MSVFHPKRTLARRLNERPFTGARQASANVCYWRIVLKNSSETRRDGGQDGGRAGAFRFTLPLPVPAAG